MEKFTKFEDKSTGINPFIPLDSQQGYKFRVFLLVKSFIILIIKIPFLLVLIASYYLFCLLSYLLIFPVIISKYYNSSLTYFIFSNLACYLFGICCWKKTIYHTTYINENKFKKIQNKSVIYLSTQSSLLEYLWLSAHLSPSFYKVCKNKQNQDNIYRLQGLELLRDSLGLPILNSPKNYDGLKLKLSNIFDSDSSGNKVIFIEGTKTNRLGLLKLSEDILKQLYELEINTSIISISFSWESKSKTFSNTTDKNGVCSLFSLLSNLRNPMVIEINNLCSIYQSSNYRTTFDRWKESVVQKLQGRLNPYYCQVDYTSHEEFLGYWNEQKKSKSKITVERTRKNK